MFFLEAMNLSISEKSYNIFEYVHIHIFLGRGFIDLITLSKYHITPKYYEPCCTVNYRVMAKSYEAKTSSLRLRSPAYYLCGLGLDALPLKLPSQS